MTQKSKIVIGLDTKNQPYIEWEQAPGIFKRAWVQKRDKDKNWANAPDGRYLNVARVEEAGKGPSGNPVDFPIFSTEISDEQILKGFVYSSCAITGLALGEEVRV